MLRAITAEVAEFFLHRMWRQGSKRPFRDGLHAALP